MSLALLPFYPLISFLLLIFLRKRLSWFVASVLSVGSVFISAASSALLVYGLSTSGEPAIAVNLWHWFTLTSFVSGEAHHVNFSFYLDMLSGVMVCVVSGVGLLIHLFAAAYMKEDENFHRFMAYMNLFLVAMLILVLADNLVLLYLGWEGVGLCSFLLIGFWYKEPDNVAAARKAFIVTRIGDTSMAIGLFLLFDSLNTLDIGQANLIASETWQVGNQQAFWIALLLLGGAVGKSAQLPLQTWLPDAMAGPTPVSALIHAATMVTAGVYLIARMHDVFLLAPDVMLMVAWIGALTLLVAGLAALAQSDIKRILAYSTMSQIGYMMLALGAGAWSAGIFHLMTHAFFKALLFLTAGAVIYALHHQQNVFKMGGLLKRLPIESILFIIGLVCLMALPGTSGFFSKEAIIATLWSSPTAGPILWWTAIIGALLTSIYSCRLFFLAFMGRARNSITITPPKNIMMRSALILLALLSLVGGFFTLDFSSVFPLEQFSSKDEPGWLHTVAVTAPFVGIALSWWLFTAYRKNDTEKIEQAEQSIQLNPIKKWCHSGLGFDQIYHVIIVKPFMVMSSLNKNDIIDKLLMSTAWYVNLWRDVFVAAQNGLLRWYAAAFACGLVLWIGAWLL